MKEVDCFEQAYELKEAAKQLVDYLYTHGTPHDIIIVKMDSVEHFSGETAARIEVRD